MFRLHGRNVETWAKPGLTPAERFRYLYSEDELRTWIDPIGAMARRAHEVHVLMNNCYRDYAVRNARTLIALLQSAPLGERASTDVADAASAGGHRFRGDLE